MLRFRTLRKPKTNPILRLFMLASEGVAFLRYWLFCRYACLRNPHIPPVCCGFASCASLKLTQFYDFLSLLLSNVLCVVGILSLCSSVKSSHTSSMLRFRILRKPKTNPILRLFIPKTHSTSLNSLTSLTSLNSLTSLTSLTSQKETPDPQVERRIFSVFGEGLPLHREQTIAFCLAEYSLVIAHRRHRPACQQA